MHVIVSNIDFGIEINLLGFRGRQSDNYVLCQPKMHVGNVEWTHIAHSLPLFEEEILLKLGYMPMMSCVLCI